VHKETWNHGSKMSVSWEDMLLGALAGFSATLPMTCVMQWMNRELPGREQLPPREVTMRAAEKTGVKEQLGNSERRAATWAAHLGMGTGLGVLYGMVGRRLPLHPSAAGAVFGLLAYGGNYQVLLPALGLAPPATQYPVRRNVLLITSHLVWGGLTGMLLNQTRRALG
jgi:uncharacterized membrane protein YagU involved in acid resistance